MWRIANAFRTKGEAGAKKVRRRCEEMRTSCEEHAKKCEEKYPKVQKWPKSESKTGIFDQKWNPKPPFWAKNGIMGHYGGKNEMQIALSKIHII